MEKQSPSCWPSPRRGRLSSPPRPPTLNSQEWKPRPVLKSLQGSMPVYQAGPELWTTKHLKRSWDHFKRKYVWFSSYLFHLCIILYSFGNIPFLYSWHMIVYLCIILYSFGNIPFLYSCYMIVYLDFLLVFPFIMIFFFINFSTTNKLECYFMKLLFIVNLMVVSIIQSIN